MSDDLFLVLSSLDQPIPVEHSQMLQRMKEIVQKSVEQQDAKIALNACRQLVQMGKVSGLTLAEGLYLIQQNWDAYQMEEDFEDIAYTYIGLHKATVQRYCRVWKMFEEKEVPEELASVLQQRNIKDLIPIGTTLGEGYELDDNDWEELAHAPDFNTVSRKLREVKGKEPRKGSLQIVMGRDGTLSAWQDEKVQFVGYLAVDEEENVIAQRAIERIIKGAGVILK